MRGLASGRGKEEGSPAAIRSGFHIYPRSRARARVGPDGPVFRGLTGRAYQRDHGLGHPHDRRSRACSTTHTPGTMAQVGRPCRVAPRRRPWVDVMDAGPVRSFLRCLFELATAMGGLAGSS
jgi:hypothetical protein